MSHWGLAPHVTRSPRFSPPYLHTTKTGGRPNTQTDLAGEEDAAVGW